MKGEVLREIIFDFFVFEIFEVKLFLKVLMMKVNEYFFVKVWEFGFNEVVGCLDFVINFLSIVEEVMKRIIKFLFLFYIYLELYYEIL